MGLSLNVGLTGLSSNPILAAELVRDLGAVCLDLLFVLRKKVHDEVSRR